MASAATRHRLHHHLRRVLSLSSYHHRYNHHQTLSNPKPLSSLLNKNPVSFQTPSFHRFFHCTNPRLAQTRSNFNDMDKIDPDTILFEGCDYKHWLIVMDFGKDPQQRPPPEQMVETYVQTLAKVLGSVEEAKKKIYACSTTTYTGFQAEIDEETSKKLEGLPGVIFVLPDSYIDPVNKEYGGDKYINGTIIPRPPPVQYGRMRRDRQTDQRSRGPMPNQGGNYGYNQNGPRSGEGRGYNMPQRENFGEGGRNYPVSDNTPYSNERNNPQRGNYNQGMPSYQGNYNQGMPSNQGNFDRGVPSNQGSFDRGVPNYQGNYNQGYNQGQRMENPGTQGGYVPPGHVNNRQGEYGYNSQGHFGNFHENHAPRGQTGYPPVSGADGRSGGGYYEREQGGYGQGQNANFGDGGRVGYGPGYTSQVGDQRFSQAPPDNVNTIPSEHGNYSPSGQSGMNQRRY